MNFVNLMKIRIKNIIIFILFPILSGEFAALNAQEISFNASAPSTVTLGMGFNYTITGNENIKSSSVKLPEVDGIRLVSGPSTFMSTQSTYTNGRLENTVQITFTYTLIATKEGKITIPPAQINHGNKNYLTEEIEITVIPGSGGQVPEPEPGQPAEPSSQSTSTSENYFIRLIPSKRTVWLGEELLLSAKIYTNENLRFSEIKYPEIEGFWKQELEADQQASREIIEGTQYLTQVFKRDLLIPQKTGTITIDPIDATVLVQQKVRTQRRNPFGDIFNDPFFNDPFFESYQNVPVNIKSNALTVEVKPLPAGAPSFFKGAVGNFSIDITTGKTDVKVNEALSVKITVKGKGNIALINAPVINFPPDVEIFDPKTEKNINHSTSGTSGSVTFEYVIIPRYPGTFRIAPVEFAYFDPLKGSYQSLKTKDITINIEKAETTEQAEMLGIQPGIQGLRQEQVTSINTDILFIKTGIPAFRKYGDIISDNLFFKFSFPAGILIFILLILFQKERIKRNRDKAYMKTRKARKIAVKRLKSAKKLLLNNDNGMYDEILKALWGYVSDKLSVEQANLSRQTAQQELRNREVNEDIIKSFIEIIDDCELARYATGITMDPKTIYQRSEDLLYKLESSIV